ncbi:MULTISPECIES: hypothetical protein [Enterobacter]|uniref:hypothetical protein n=1 Tax=Enterobacter TaxID=547 RepID=UPI001F47D147|nr:MULTISPECIES: hypothetical protein [Enterobacter]MCM7169101.1 hypothetical protein [Enterobacter quasiroggenkampii]WJW93794.1 hypothetical protein QVH37_17675 [Enterobacter pseudoroggenkampii]
MSETWRRNGGRALKMRKMDDKVSESGRQIAINGAGIAGAAAGGAMAGLMCGPGAPVCVLIGGFVGGALAAWEMGRLWN